MSDHFSESLKIEEAMSDHFSESLKIEEAKVKCLPPEILTKIVVRLPIKSIITWTSVSKSWNSLIKRPKFIFTHLNHNATDLLLLSHMGSEYKNKYEIEAYSLHRDSEAFDKYRSCFYFPLHVRRINGVSKVVGTCNGLVCLADDGNFFVWNPSIRKYVTLPKPNDVGVVISTACYGFGFDSKSNHYKVVRVANISNRGELGKYAPKVDVYSLDTREWKTVTAVPPKCSLHKHDTPAFVNGALHWPVFRSTNDGFHNFVLAFNLGNEDFREIELPEDLLDSHGLSVSVCGKSLALFRGVQWDDLYIHVWVMNEYGELESWTEVLTVGQQESGVEVWPLGFRKSGEVVIEKEKGELVSIDTESTITDLSILGHGFTFVHPFVESLVLLDKSLDAVSY